MHTIMLCLFVAAILPYIAKLPVVYSIYQDGPYDNSHPRKQQAQLTGFGARALAAHLNSFESFALFGIAVVTAIATHHITPTVENLCILHIIMRFAYHIIYLVNLGILRTIVWTIGALCSVTILYICI